jgi:ribosomal protein RSM22 (predicted rRNA methylase)
MDGNMERVEYPGELENWWIAEACSHYAVSNLSECSNKIEQNVQRLSDHFTINRKNGFRNLDDPELLIAYGLFFFPQNYARVQFVLREVLQRGWRLPDNKTPTILDVGAGTGAASLGVAQCLNTNVNILALDRSNRALQYFGRIAGDVVPGAIVRQQPLDIASAQMPSGKYDLVIANFALNELAQDPSKIFKDLLLSLSEGGLLLILEPALEEASIRLEKWRDRIAEEKEFHLWAPCLHHRSCPLLKSGVLWCHEARRWTPPKSGALLNRHLYRSIEILKFSFLAISTQPPPAIKAGPAVFRLISPVTKTKGKWIASGCASDGNKHEYEWLKRDLNSEMARELGIKERGDVVEVQEAAISERSERIRVSTV